MTFLLIIFVVLLCIGIGVSLSLLWLEKKNSASLVDQLESLRSESTARISAISSQFSKCKDAYAKLRSKAESELKRLHAEVKVQSATIGEQREKMERWQVIVDAEAEAERITREAITEARRLQQEAEQTVTRANAYADEATLRGTAELESAKDVARQISSSAASEAAKVREAARKESEMQAEAARQTSDALKQEAVKLLDEAGVRATEVLADAERRAVEIAGEAYSVKQDIGKYERILRAIKNELQGYGDEYIVPSHSLLDDLAEEFGFAEAGQKLKDARSAVKGMVKAGSAAVCDYVETNRRETAVRFVVDAFNGKVDSVLALVKHDNYGKLSQQIKDAFVLVNSNGEAFRNARIRQEYLNARLDELKWATVTHELRKREQEEQRLIKEQMREEQKARKEYERALRDAAREEEVVQKAMARLQEQLGKASAEERIKYEGELQVLHERLRLAEEKGQRAISMAQQTKSGHVYIISNIGSFGEHVYKIGLTRRLEPRDRVRELGDSSVPFEFDIHALIKSEDAPALENKLHRHFLLHQVNKVNHRKEFFRCDLATIRSEVETLGLQAQWTMRFEASDYRETLAIERKIAGDPVAREQWLHRQLELELSDYDDELVGVGADGDDTA